MDRKIIFFDIDGTIITEDTNIIPKSTIKAIKEARKNGHLAFINTGRTYSNIENSIKEVGFDGYVCGCGTYIKAGEQVLFTKTLDKKTCQDIVKILRECKIDAVLEGLEDVYFDGDNIKSEEILKLKHTLEKKGLGITKNWDSEDLQYDKFFAIANQNSNLKEFKAFLKKDFDCIDRENNRWEVVPKGCSKATGIEFLLNYYNIALENSYAIGDSSNDLSMLEYVQNGIAMENCDQCISDIASFITKDIKEDGILHALKHYRIIPINA